MKDRDRSLAQLKGGAVSDLTRRGFVVNAAGTTAGMTALGLWMAERASADGPPHDSRAVVAYIGDPRTGEISVMVGDREVTVRDPQLTARIVRAAR
jgi:hypothetical protein